MVKSAIYYIIVLYIICNIMPFFEGLSDARYGKSVSRCGSKLSRIEYVFPGYRLGCWAGTVPEDDYVQ